MQKILLVLNSRELREQTVRFACFLSRLTKSRLTAIFIENPILEKEMVINENAGIPYVESFGITQVPETIESITSIGDHISRFETIAAEEGVKAGAFLEKMITPEDIIRESRYADFIIVEPGISFAGPERAPGFFVKAVLQQAECPVVIAPDSFHGIDNIVFCYDGGKSSVFAIKQFIHLFPELKIKKLQIVYLDDSSEFTGDEEEAITGWMRHHFNEVEFMVPGRSALGALFSYLKARKNDFVVMGAYGKGLLASFFRNEDNGRDSGVNTLPIMIAHS